MPEPAPDPELPEIPADDEAQRRDLDELVDDVRAEDTSYAAQTEASTTVINAEMTKVTDRLTTTPSVDNAVGTLPTIASAAIADPAPDARLDAFEQKAAATTAELAKSPEKDKQWTTAQFLSATFGLSVLAVGVGLLFEHLVRKANQQPDNDLPPLPPATDDTVSALIQQWQAYDDGLYWTSLASYLTSHPGAFTGTQQIVFMNMTIQLCPPKSYFLWQSALDKANTAQTFVDTYNSAGDTAAMYRLMATYTYHGAPLPRAVAADVLRLALCWALDIVPSPSPPVAEEDPR